jgi:hypothetical protein
MGLDMYLTKSEYFSINDGLAERSNDYREKHQKGMAIAEIAGLHPYTAWGGIEVTATVAYWRKANQVHAWFVKNVQNGVDDCGKYYVSIEQLKALRSEAQTTLDNPEAADAILPTQDGFFFGSTEYDQYYIQDLEHTVEMLDKVIETHKERDYYQYQSSW